MKKISDIVDQISFSGDASDPEVIKADVQVRTSGHILPPSRLKLLKHKLKSKAPMNHPIGAKSGGAR